MRFIEAGTWSELLTPEHCWIWSLANVKGANKDARIYDGRCATLHSFCFSLIRLAWILRNQNVSIQLVPQCRVNNYCVLCTVKAKKAKKKKNVRFFYDHPSINYGAKRKKYLSCWKAWPSLHQPLSVNQVTEECRTSYFHFSPNKYVSCPFR